MTTPFVHGMLLASANTPIVINYSAVTVEIPNWIYSDVSLPHLKTKKTQGVNLESLYKWWPLCESNTAPTDYESAALTKHELRGRKAWDYKLILTVFEEAAQTFGARWVAQLA